MSRQGRYESIPDNAAGAGPPVLPPRGTQPASTPSRAQVFTTSTAAAAPKTAGDEEYIVETAASAKGSLVFCLFIDFVLVLYKLIISLSLLSWDNKLFFQKQTNFFNCQFWYLYSLLVGKLFFSASSKN